MEEPVRLNWQSNNNLKGCSRSAIISQALEISSFAGVVAMCRVLSSLGRHKKRAHQEMSCVSLHLL